jgi:hypothetical protein
LVEFFPVIEVFESEVNSAFFVGAAGEEIPVEDFTEWDIRAAFAAIERAVHVVRVGLAGDVAQGLDQIGDF